MRRCGVQVVIEFLAVLTMIAFAVGKAEKTLFENWIASVPKGKRQAEPLVMIAEAGEAILAPSIGAAAGVVVRQVFPRVAVWAVIFTHRAPLALAEICAPFAPQTILGLVSHLLFDTHLFGDPQCRINTTPADVVDIKRRYGYTYDMASVHKDP